MPELNQILFSWKEVTELLLKQQDIHEGLWTIALEFGITGAAIPFPPLNNAIIPAAILGIPKVGIQRADKVSALTVDAAEVNPAAAPVAPDP